MRYLVCIPLFVWIVACQQTAPLRYWSANDKALHYYGRALTNEKGNIILIGSASYVEWNFTGDSCIVLMQANNSEKKHGYVVAEIDGEYMGRIKVAGDTLHNYTIRASSHKKIHQMRLFKATEAQNGEVMITGVKSVAISAAIHPRRPKIEFIGNSITCGMGNDLSGLPCGKGEWYDQHNAYLAYGPIAARTLNLDCMLSAVSGIGMYRTWNTDFPNMPLVYENAYLSPYNKMHWNFSTYIPDIVSICLGTNDLSDGDGKTPRAAFDSSIFIKRYTDFVGTIYKHYPNTKILLLTSPMLTGEKAEMLFACLHKVKEHITTIHPEKKSVEIFRFNVMQPQGCSYHPSREDHQMMAEQLVPVLGRLLAIDAL